MVLSDGHGEHSIAWEQPSRTSDIFLVFSLCVLDNWALIYAQKLALKENLPLHVCFCLFVPKSELSTLRHYSFMLKGLEEVEKVLKPHFTLLPQFSTAAASLYFNPFPNSNAKPWTSSSTCCLVLQGRSSLVLSQTAS